MDESLRAEADRLRRRLEALPSAVEIAAARALSGPPRGETAARTDALAARVLALADDLLERLAGLLAEIR